MLTPALIRDPNKYFQLLIIGNNEANQNSINWFEKKIDFFYSLATY